MTKLIAVLVAAISALLIVSAASAHRPQGDDTFCVTNGDGTFVQLTHTNRQGLAWFLEHHEGWRTAGAKDCETPPVEPPVVIPPVVVPVIPTVIPAGPGSTFLCISKFAGTVPSAVTFSDVAKWLAEGDFVPKAKLGFTPGGINLGPYTLYCTDGPSVSTSGIADGVVYDARAWIDVLKTYGTIHVNHYGF